MNNNLTERLDKHLTSIRESNGEISSQELLQLVKQNKKKIFALKNFLK